MPVERQAERLSVPLRRVDRIALGVIGLLAAVAIAAAAIYALSRSGDPAGVRCFTATYASSVGGATVHQCGSAAVHYCRFDAGLTPVSDACRADGFAVGAKP